MGITRDVWWMPRAGSLDRLERRTEPLPEPGPGEARVRVEAIGLNFADVFACLGLYSATPKGPFVPGLECAGVVEAIGPAAAGRPERLASAEVRPGDRVMALTRFGGYATALNLDTRYLRKAPDGWSATESAAYPVQALTAWYGLVHLGAVDRGDVVLVQSAAGGVGLNALALLEQVGGVAVATVGRAVKRDFLVRHTGLPPDRIIVREASRFEAQLDAALKAAGTTGFDIVFDAIAGPFLRPAYDRLRPEGRLLVYGAADFMPAASRPNYVKLAWQYVRRPRIDPVQMISENRAVMGFNLIWLWDQVNRLPEALAATAALIRRAPHVGGTFAFGEAPAAMRRLQSGESVGKIVLTV